MPRRVQITIPIANQPGTLAGVAAVLGSEGINIQAMTTFEGQVHLVPDDHLKAASALREAGYPCLKGNVLELHVEHAPGALAAVASRLAGGGVNIDYAFSGPGRTEGMASLFLAVSDMEKAERLA